MRQRGALPHAFRLAARAGGLLRTHTPRALASSVVLLLALDGCKQPVDLAAVRGLSTSAATSQALFDRVAADYGASCVRRDLYASIGAALETGLARGTPAPRPASGAAATPPAPSADPGHACDLPIEAGRAWQRANATIVAYFVALGKLAGGAPPGDSYGVKALGTAVAAAKGLTSAQGSAIGSFANEVLDNVYAAKRAGALAAYIPQADAALGGAIAVVESLATDNYANALGRERIAANQFFARTLQLTRGDASASDVLNYADAWSQRIGAIDDRTAAILAYTSAWDTLRASHATLLRAIASDDPAGAVALAQAASTAIAADAGTIAAAYAKER